MTKSASRLLKVLAFSLATAAISQGGVVHAATMPDATLQAPVEKGLRTPTRLAVAADGSLYVADPASQGVLKFSPAGKLLQKIPVAGIPQGIAVTSTGQLLVCQKELVALYDVNGSKIGQLGSGAGQFVSASDIALDDAGRIYVTDSKGRCVQVFDASGAYLFRFGAQGSGAGQFLYPSAIAYEKISKQIAVVDSLNARVQFYDTTGAFVRAIGGNGTGPLKFMHPQGIAFDYVSASAVRMYVSDGMLKNIQAIEPNGTGAFISYVTAGKGTHHGSPSALAFDQNSKCLYVVDGLGSVTVYRIADGSVVVNSVVPDNSAVIASSAQSSVAANVSTTAQTTVAPFSLSMVADGSAVQGEILDVTGIATDVTSVTVNGVPVAITRGLFSTAVLLQTGANAITVTATDRSGKVWTEVRNVVKGAALPVLTVATPDLLATNSPTLLLTGSVDKDVYVTVAGLPADIDSQSWRATVTLTSGMNSIEVQAIDLNGQVVTQKRTVFYNPSAPAVAITTPGEDALFTTKSTSLSGTVTMMPGVKFSAHVDGKPVSIKMKDGSFTVPVRFTKEGVYSVTVTATLPGGISSTVERSVVYRKKQ